MTTLRHIFALLVLIALPGHFVAEELSKENCPLFKGGEWSEAIAETKRREAAIPIDSTRFAIADSLHRATAVELRKLTDLQERPVLMENAVLTGLPDSTATQAAPDSTMNASPLSLEEGGGRGSRRQLRQQRLANFTPDPSKATWSALVFPGGGQIYNHKYWKLPIVYGGFLGCAYALNWNNQMYSDYSQAYLDIMDDDPGTASYEDFLPPRYNVEANKDYLTRVFKNRKDNYRRQRDLSIFCFIGVYLISVVDAYVDAELSNFDITDDLSVQVRPTTISNQQYTLRNQAYGLQCSLSF